MRKPRSVRAERASVKINMNTFDSVKGFAGAMKRTANSVIEEALNDWLNTVGHANLEAQATVASVKAAFRQPICIDEYKAERSEGATA